jgi:glutamine amidotransferase
MCELLAITSKQPTTVAISLGQFARHGSDTSDNKDGWGIVYYAEDDIRRFRDIGPAAASEWVSFAEKQALRSTLFLAHIRHANVGKISLANTHPFSRELGGSMHTFAHNGFLMDITESSAFKPGRFRPLGDTDSEWAFCTLLDRLCPMWMTEEHIPDIADRYRVISAFARDAREFGTANFIYCDGDAIFVHSDQRRQSDSEIRAPGIWLSQQRCSDATENVLGGGVKIDSPNQQVVIAASVPLTGVGWEPMRSGSLVALKDGEIWMSAQQ